MKRYGILGALAVLTALSGPWLYHRLTQNLGQATLDSREPDSLKKAYDTDPLTRATLGILEVQIGMKMTDMGHQSHVVKAKAVSKAPSKSPNIPPVFKYVVRGIDNFYEVEISDRAMRPLFRSGTTVALVKASQLEKLDKRNLLRSRASIKFSPNLEKSLIAKSQSEEYELVRVGETQWSAAQMKALEKQKAQSVFQLENLGAQRTLIVPVGEGFDLNQVSEKFLNPNNPNSLDSVYRRWSRGQTWLVGNITNPLSGPRCINSETSGIASYVIEKLDEGGAYDLTQVDRLIILLGSPAECDGRIWGTIGKGAYPLRRGLGRFSISWVYDFDHPTGMRNGIVHELGHNLTLGHASQVQCIDSDLSSSGALCSWSEYGDFTQYMGSHSFADPAMSATQISQIGWTNSSTFPTVTNGTYTLKGIYSWVQSGGLSGIRIPLAYFSKMGSMVAGDGFLTLDYFNSSEGSPGVYMRYHVGQQNTMGFYYYRRNQQGQYETLSDGVLESPGETFEDSTNGIRVKLEAITATQATVSVSSMSVVRPADTPFHIQSIRTQREVLGSGASCSRFFVDIEDPENRLPAQEWQVSLSSTIYRYPELQTCEFHSTLSGGVKRFACNKKIPNGYSLSAVVWPNRIEDQRPTARLYRGPINCDEGVAVIAGVQAAGFTNDPINSPYCESLNLTGAGTNLLGRVYNFVAQEQHPPYQSVSCSGAASGDSIQCLLYGMPRKKWRWISLDMDQGTAFASIPLAPWTCFGEEPYKFDLDWSTLPPSADRIFSDGFDSSSGSAGQPCTRVRAYLRVNSHFSGVPVEFTARNLDNTQIASCTANVPVFSAGERVVGCEFLGLSPSREHYVEARWQGFTASGFYNSAICRE